MKFAVVTGGTRGIGKQICIDLLQNGFYVITNYFYDVYKNLNQENKNHFKNNLRGNIEPNSENY